MKTLLALVLSLVFVGSILAEPTTQPAKPLSLETAVAANTAQSQELYNKFLEKIYVWMDKGGDFVGNNIEKGANFIADQAPLVCREIVYFGIACNGAWCCSGLFLIVNGIVFFRRSITNKDKIKWFQDIGCDNPTWRMVRLFLGCILLVIGLPIFFWNISDLLMAIFAPRLYVLQYIADLLKTHQT